MKNWILFIGGIFSQSSMLKSLAISPAANRWQKGLIKAMNEQGPPVILLSHFPESIWPRGKHRPGRPGDLDPRFESHLVSYWNIPLFRSISLSRVYMKAFREICEQHGKPSVVLSYNPYPHAVSIGLYAQKHYQIPWIDICADHQKDPGIDWSKYSTGANMARGHVFLSYQAFKDCPFPKKLHLDGGVNPFQIKPETQSNKNSSRNKIIVYTGMLSKWGGIIYLLKAFHKIKDPNVKLWICGHGSSPELNSDLKRDFRIRFFGLVSESKLNEIYRDASVFVNPRPSQVPGNKMNFPSKVLEYLSYGKPVISTWTAGLSPEYRDVLEIFEEETEFCLANKIEEVLNWSEHEIYKNREKIKNYLLEKKTWDLQASNLISWLNNEII